MTDLSIIIPVYNVEKYILECLRGFRNQLDFSIEIIIINDGSTDSSPEIVKDFINQFPENLKSKFTLLKQSNKGVSAARNYGLSVAKGQYVTFVDSDDYVSEKYINSIIEAIKHRPEIIQIGAHCFFENNSEKNCDLDRSKLTGFHQFSQDLKLEIFNQNHWFSFLRVYQREIFSNFIFPEHLSHFEDAYIVTQILEKAQNIYLINESLYNYRIRENSATRDIDSNVKDKLLNSCEAIIKQLIDLNKQNMIYAIPLIHFFNIYIEESKKYKSKKIARENWNKFAQNIKKNQISKHIITDVRERFLLLFLSLGILGHYLSKKIYKIVKIIN